LNLEEKNKEKRKGIPLTTKEWLTFFFFPFQNDGGFLNTHDFNEKENKRLEKFGFDRKIEEASQVRTLGVLNYAIVIMIILIIMNW
tara:strand:- start:33 stop:290 length:258 start_codon:yes stop_codon:yes gene_type:complete